MPFITHKKTAYHPSAANYTSDEQQEPLSCSCILFNSLLVFPLSASWSLTWCIPTLAFPKILDDSPGVDSFLLSLLFPLSRSTSPWRLFLLLCPQEASTDQVLGPSAFPGAHSSKLGTLTLKSNRSAGHSLDNRPWLTQATEGQRRYEYIFSHMRH